MIVGSKNTERAGGEKRNYCGAIDTNRRSEDLGKQKLSNLTYPKQESRQLASPGTGVRRYSDTSLIYLSTLKNQP
jgi:hypothetical protein